MKQTQQYILLLLFLLAGCQWNLDKVALDCDLVDCVNGICNEATGECECEDGWTGLLCDEVESGSSLCEGVDCVNGTCNEGTGECECEDGWTGALCDEVVEANSLCANVDCVNGTCNEGTGECECEDGWTGTNCEEVDTTQIQLLLNANVTPQTLFDWGVILEQLYGKMYKGGLIFYLNTTDGTGMVAATQDQSDYAEWGCDGTFIGANSTAIGTGSQNTIDIVEASCSTIGIAAALCANLDINSFDDWFLPSKYELIEMYYNIGPGASGANHNIGGFAADSYWSSSESNISNVSYLHFVLNVDTNVFFIGIKSSNKFFVRAVRAF